MEEEICGEVMEENPFDKKVKVLNLELVKVIDKDKNFHYQIHFQDWTPISRSKTKVKGTNLVRLHLKDAVKLKSIIDNLVWDAMKDAVETRTQAD